MYLLTFVSQNANPFVVILINGDSMIFEDDLVKASTTGGTIAATRLRATIQRYIDNGTKGIPKDAKVICRVYADLSGLADLLVRAGVVSTVETVEEFMRGLTCGEKLDENLFDFVDVGPGRNRVNAKILGRLLSPLSL